MNHLIDDSFAQSHSLVLADMNGDGLPDLVTGKRFWAHGPTGDVRTLATDVRARLQGDAPAVVVLIGAADGKAAVVAALNDAAQARGLAAGELGRAVSPFIDGKGGGKADMAQGGGTDVSRIAEALAAVTAIVAGA